MRKRVLWATQKDIDFASSNEDEEEIDEEKANLCLMAETSLDSEEVQEVIDLYSLDLQKLLMSYSIIHSFSPLSRKL